MYLVRRVGSVNRVSAIHLESIDYLDKTFKYKGKRYPISAFNQWVYVADTEKDVDYIRFFAHYGNYTMLIERERVHRECLSLLEGIMANIKKQIRQVSIQSTTNYQHVYLCWNVIRVRTKQRCKKLFMRK